MQEEVNKKNASALRAAIDTLRSELDTERAERSALAVTLAALQQRLLVVEGMLQGMLTRVSSGPTAR